MILKSAKAADAALDPAAALRECFGTRKQSLLWILALSFASTSPLPAALTLSIQSGSFNPGQTGGLEVTLTNNNVIDPNASAVTVTGFSFGIDQSGGSMGSLNFTSASTSTSVTPYIFSGTNSFANTFLSGTIGTGAGSSIVASDVYVGPADGTVLNPGQTLALGEVAFDLPTSASGTFTLSFDPAATSLAYQGMILSVAAMNPGFVSVFSSTMSQVPEPSDLTLFTLLAACLGVFIWRLRQHRRKGSSH